MIDLDRLPFLDMVKLGVSIRRDSENARFIEDVAERVAESLHRELRVGEQQEAGTALVRVFVTAHWRHLDAAQREAAGSAEAPLGYLALAGSAGLEPHWNSTRDSRHHRVMSLTELSPMLRSAFEAPDDDSSLDLLSQRIGMFHVRDARDGARVPDQEFVERYGVRSLVGFTMDIPPDDRVVLVRFTRTTLSYESVLKLRPLALDAWLSFLQVSGARRSQLVDREAPDPNLNLRRLRGQVVALRELVQLHQRQVEENLEAVLNQQTLVERREQRQRAILETLPDDIYRIGSDGSLSDLASSKTRVSHSQEVQATLTELGRVAITSGLPQRFVVSEGENQFEYRVVRVDSTEALCLARDVSELSRAEQEAAEAWQQALAASRAKSEFLASISHEIRTPLNGVIGLLELLKRTELAGEQVDFVKTAERSAQHLLELVNGILDLSKIEAGRIELESIPFELRRVVRDALALAAVRAWEKGIEIEEDVCDEVPDWVLGDPLRLRQVLLNLLGNAIKFSDKGTIRVWVGADTDGLLFSVEDQGIGIPPEAQARVFDAFQQADQSTSRRFGGTGLGLTLCKRFVELMGGRIWLESEVGKGTKFHFSARLRATTKPINTSSLPVLESSHSVLPIPLYVLVAEDNSVNRLVITRLLDGLGHRVDSACNGLEAVEMVQKRDYDLVLMDVEMPEVDGIAATGWIRAAEGETGKHVPIFALTAHATPEHARLCREAGMDDVLTKPIDVQRLEPALARVARRKAAGARVEASQKVDPRPQLDVHSLPIALPSDPVRVSNLLARDEAVERLGGDEALWLELVDAVRLEAPRLELDLGKAIDERRSEVAARTAHSLKGALLNIGARVGVGTAAEVESLAAAEEWAKAQEKYAELSAELAELRVELSAWAEQPAA